MATPSVTNVYPNRGHTGGEALVRVLGGGFRTPPSLLDGDVIAPGPALQTVRVEFGAGNVSPHVIVVNAALLYARTPASVLVDAVTQGATGTVDVIITNLDANGDPIPGESVTYADGFSYEDVLLTDEADLARVVRALVVKMRQQTIREVVLSQHTDYDADTADGLNLVEVATIPAIALIGPQLEENRFYSRNDSEAYADPTYGGQSVVRRAPYTVNLYFDVILIANKTRHILNLQAAVVRFFDRNRYLRMARDPGDASAGEIEYEMDFDANGVPSVTTALDDGNVRSATGRIIVRGVDVESLAGFGALEGDAALTRTFQVTEDADLDTVTVADFEELL